MSRLGRVLGTGAPGLVPEHGWSAWLVPLAAAAMAFLAVLTLATAGAAARLGAEWRDDLAAAATVRIAGADATAADRVLEVLSATPGVAAARRIGRDEQTALLAPWLGDGAALSDLPVPELVAVTLSGEVDGARLGARLAEVAPGAVWDDHAAWRGPLLRAASAVERVALGAAALVALAAGGIVALAARASLAANGEIVRVIRLIGGEEGFITRAFVRPVVLRTALGAAAGAALGVGVLAALPAAGPELGLALAPGRATLAGLALGVPAGAALVAWATAHVSVRAALGRLP